MSSYAEIARQRKRARTLYLELRALGLELRVEEDPEHPAYCRVVVGGLRSLSETHADRVEQRVLENEAGLAQILLSEWDPDLEAVRWEGSRT